MAIGDIDRDGRVDIATANAGSDNVTIFLQNAAGTFGSATVIGGAGATIDPTDIAIVDVDRDGRADIVTTQTGNDTVTVYYQSITGAFPAVTTLGGGGTTDDPRGFQVADVNGGIHSLIFSSKDFSPS